MGRVAQTTPKSNLIAVVVIALAVAGIGLGLWSNNGSSPNSNQPTSVEQSADMQISYQGEDGKTVLDLLKENAKVETKSSSLGEYVVSINGDDGDGTKYWLFYVNGKEANVGAGAYATKSGDTVVWKLQ
ncbi:hypothetical protein A3A68_01090 [Candidatus Saccharibacteria bacterium RIFCSPLOWO2_01_FULL_48_13]|nr:MAG: hypothetical protein A2884_01590 [Candidatus Saccharibacteria bacterium RIFCSPHIGHO2_01_FULL_48_12]OGL35450.1 MAG: hypothetical protein A3F38_02655 [Candidatus Saccharibacteria bacterium RIFCSPHIGHO2_12_FULL_48_21]OGL37033.1 MAG: hypothetical protein A3A68_01090 [Candidatus Saccharibacteria bacterium RIFCSPLOWO2_01_FULL_48_13]